MTVRRPASLSGAGMWILPIGCMAALAACESHPSSSADFCSTGKRPLDWPTVDNSALLQRYWQGGGSAAEIAADLGAADGSTIPDATKLAVIGRGMDVYPHFDAYMLSFLVEPMVPRIVAEVHAGAADESDVARNIASWAASQIVHTQTLGTFRDQCGHDPWGGTPAGGACKAFHRKASGAEMLAKSMYSGKLTGKCEAIPGLVTAVFALSGAPWDDVVILRLRSHNLGLVRFGGQIYLINNTAVSVVDEAAKQSLLSNTYYGFSSYSITVYRDFAGHAPSFVLDETVFSSDHSLVENLLLLTGTRDRWLAGAAAGLGVPDGGAIDPDRVFAFAPLTRYAHQSLGVSDPERYLEASLRAPRTRELASQLSGAADVARWIRENVAHGSIFEESAGRIMTAEDVIVFRRGTWKDQALLASALLVRMGYSPEMLVTAEDAFVVAGDGAIYAASNWQTVPEVQGTVLLRIRAP